MNLHKATMIYKFITFGFRFNIFILGLFILGDVAHAASYAFLNALTDKAFTSRSGDLFHQAAIRLGRKSNLDIDYYYDYY